MATLKYAVVLRDDRGAKVTNRVTVIESDEDITRLGAHAHILSILGLSNKKVGTVYESVEAYRAEQEAEAVEEVDTKSKSK